MQKLQRRQNPDGGWGWWGNEKSSPFTSTYVVFGLLQRAERRLRRRSDDRRPRPGLPDAPAQAGASRLQGWELNQQAFILYVLALAGQGDIGRTVALYDVRERLAHYGQAWLALAFEQLRDAGETTAQERIDVLVDDLLGSAIVSATGAHWEEATPNWQTMNTDTRSAPRWRWTCWPGWTRTADGLAPNAVRWLMVDRQDGVW